MWWSYKAGRQIFWEMKKTFLAFPRTAARSEVIEAGNGRLLDMPSTIDGHDLNTVRSAFTSRTIADRVLMMMDETGKRYKSGKASKEGRR